MAIVLSQRLLAVDGGLEHIVAGVVFPQINMRLRGAEELAQAVKPVGIVGVFTEHGDGVIQAAAGITGFGRLAIPVEAAKVDVVKGLADYRLGNGGGELFVFQPVAETIFREDPAPAAYAER